MNKTNDDEQDDTWKYQDAKHQCTFVFIELSILNYPIPKKQSTRIAFLLAYIILHLCFNIYKFS